MNMQNVISFNNATGANFPELDKTGFTAKFHPIELSGFATKINDKKAVIRTDTNEPLGIVGNTYGIAQNQELRNQLIESCEKVLPREYMRDITLSEFTSGGGAFTRFEFTFPNAAASIRQTINATTGRNRETILNFKLSVINSFNGSGCVIGKAGCVDLVCLNGMVANVYDTSKKRHTSGFDVTMFADFIDEQARDYMKRVQIWQQWANRSITPDQAETLLKEAGLSERLTKKFLEQLDKEFSDRGQNLWAVASAATYYSSHNSELFPVRNSANVDNVAFELNKRETQITNLFNSPAWQQFAAAA